VTFALSPHMSLGYTMNLLMDSETELYLESRKAVWDILKEDWLEIHIVY
jgi:hypothetical protein